MDIKTNLSQDVLFMQTVVDGSVYPVCSQTYIKEEYKEFVCNHDDDILERYLADSEISPADYWNTIIALVAKAKVYPVLHGSAMFNIGINELLDAISSFILPPASVSNRLSAYLYKIEHDPKGHKRSFLKIIDGSLRLRDIVRINDSEKFIKIKNLKTIYQGREINVDEVGANDIAIVEDIADFRIGDYLGGATDSITLTGGCAKNAGLKQAIEHVLKFKVVDLKTDPQLMGALGAAEYARQKGLAKK